MLNQLNLMGRLTADPEIKTTTTGKSVVSFTLAVDRDHTPSGEERKTDFVNCVAWNGTAEFISKYFRKGKLMAVAARLQSRQYENTEGKKITVWEALVSNAYFGGDKTESSPNIGYSDSSQNYTEIDGDDGDLPF